MQGLNSVTMLKGKNWPPICVLRCNCRPKTILFCRPYYRCPGACLVERVVLHQVPIYENKFAGIVWQQKAQNQVIGRTWERLLPCSVCSKSDDDESASTVHCYYLKQYIWLSSIVDNLYSFQDVQVFYFKPCDINVFSLGKVDYLKLSRGACWHKRMSKRYRVETLCDISVQRTAMSVNRADSFLLVFSTEYSFTISRKQKKRNCTL